MLLNDFLERSASLYDDKVALVVNQKEYSYKDINRISNAVANSLIEHGVAKGARVAILLDNSMEAVVSIFGILKAGCTFLTINHSTKSKKLEYILNNSGATQIISSWRKVGVLKDACNNTPTLLNVYLTDFDGSSATGIHKKILSMDEVIKNGDHSSVSCRSIDVDLATIIYTSGSTGNPKGVMMTHHNMVSASTSITQYLEKRPDDIILNTLPLSFDYGLYQIIMAFQVGATVILEKTFLYPYKVIDIIVKECVTVFPIVPTISAILIRLKGIKDMDFPCLRIITNTAAALPVAHIAQLSELFSDVRIFSMYGLTECKRVSYLHPSKLKERPDSVGKAMPNTEVFIVDENGNKVGPNVEGELVVRGSSVMRGYWEMPEETARTLKRGSVLGERLLYTGDIFRMDEEGYLYFISRKDDIIKSRGEKVSPKDIENVIYELKDVIEVAVLGVPDEVIGQALKAFVVKADDSELAEKEVQKFCSQRLEDFMVPKYVEFIDELPKTTTGKIKKIGLGTV